MTKDASSPAMRRVIAAAAVDTAGVGMFEPLTFLYFVLTTNMGTIEVGAGITAGTMLALPVGAGAAFVIDRWGVQRMVLLSNVVGAIGFLLYLSVHSLGMLIVAVFVVMSAERFYSGAWPAFVALVGEGRGLDRLYARIGSWKTASLGLGYLVGGGVLALGHGELLPRVVVGVDIVTYLVAAALIATVRMGPESKLEGQGPSMASSVGRPATSKSWLRLVDSRAFAILCVGQTLFAFAWVMPTIAMPTYLVTRLHLPHWLPSAALALNVFLISLLQRPGTQLVAGFRRSRVLAAAAVAMLLSIMFIWLASYLDSYAILCSFIAMSLFSLGEVLSGPTSNAFVMALAPRGQEGRYSSLFQLT